ncbi:MAG: CsbD family protein [Lacunisphaera sp.]
MKDSTKNEIEGGAKQASGKVVRSPGLRASGQDEQFEGKVQKKVGQIERMLEE